MVEWFKAPVLKTGVGQPTEGSNPSLSVLYYKLNNCCIKV